MSNFKRFDRHEVFEMSDTSFVLDCIKETDKHDYENGGAELANMLFGLFDGFYYDKIHSYAAEWLPIEMFERLIDLLVKIDEKLMQDNLATTE
mgnify:FL=1